jgi:hypothetical protein
VAFAVFASIGCKSKAADEAASGSPVPGVPDGDDAAPPRRPIRRYYLAHTDERCEVYSVEGDAISSPTPTPCPGDLLVGERIRIAGKTCIREGTRDVERQVPVVCPDPLTNRERDDRDKDR